MAVSRDPCEGKRTYLSHSDARRFIRRVQSMRGGGKATHAYRCPKCDWWHVTSLPKRRRRLEDK